MRSILLLSLVVGLMPLTSFAQAKVELTPFVGYRFGGEIVDYDIDLFDDDIEVESDTSYGLLVGIPISNHVKLELMYDRQDTRFTNSRLFADETFDIDADVTYYHMGVLYQWTPSHVKPFVTGSLGITRLEPDIPGVGSEERFSASLGGGVTMQVSRNVGVRLEGRGFWTNTDDWDWDRDWDCDWHDCDDYWSWDRDLFQHEFRVGVVLGF